MALRKFLNKDLRLNMEVIELLDLLAKGEDSTRQFKQDVTNADSLAAEMIAFSNGSGGKIFIGINDDGNIAGLTNEDIRRINQLISNTASQNIQPAINPITENIKTDDGLVMHIDIPAGINKPYQDKNGVFWVKSGADKRRATSREEIQRLFQKSNLIHADEIPVTGVTVADLDLDYFKNYFQERFGETLDSQKLPYESIEELVANALIHRDYFLSPGIYGMIPISNACCCISSGISRISTISPLTMTIQIIELFSKYSGSIHSILK